MEAGAPAANHLSVRIRKSFSGQTAFTLEVDFSAAAGFTILFGASGAGKTTLLDCVAGLQRPEAGRIAIGETALFDSGPGLNLPPNRRSVGYHMQSLALFPHMTVQQNVQYGLHALPRFQRERLCGEILEAFRIAGLAGRRPERLSAGERQRAALSRTLVTRPRLLLLDEPLTALDAATRSQILDDLRAWNRKQRIPVLYVTHHREEVFALGDNVIVIEAGRIVAQGLPHEVLQRPQFETVAQLAGFENIFDCVVLADHPQQGTMTCRIAGSMLDLEVPLSRVDVTQPLRVGIRAGDILLASVAPQGLSARNVLPGVITALEQRDVTVTARVDCGAQFEVHLTPAARQSLHLAAGQSVWLVIKTYSCHVLQKTVPPGYE
ncbi:MAG TPA: molybdenum ABC transporter ATP-binding protein [Candidatus Binatia bacterium]|nr:molybdenum ABC transporter ATP-binding protein [Candidatus Binatia bacterium]